MKSARFTLRLPVFVMIPLLLFLVPLLPACADGGAIKKKTYSRSHHSSAARPTKARRHAARYHTVRKGENLYRIAKRYHRTVAQLKSANGIRDVTNLEVGTRLRIPAASYKSRSRSITKKRYAKKPIRRSMRRSGYRPPPRNLGISLAWPLKSFTITSRYGIRGSGKHDGLDLGAPRGASIRAAANGTVIFAGPGPTGYGNVVILKHTKRVISVYAHNERNYVRKGSKVRRGDRIAAVGRTGRASGYHLHFELRVDRKPLDPETYLPRRRK